MSDYTRINPDRWEWVNKNTHYEVRIFAQTETLVWSVWAETSEVPQFGDGIKQTFDRFLDVHAPDKRFVPESVLHEVEERIRELREPSARSSKRNWQFWKR